MMKADWSQRAQNRTICTQVCASLTQCVGRPYSAFGRAHDTNGRAGLMIAATASGMQASA